jgi:DNA repair exonuclease SbcCD ATPase subunit
MTMAPTRNNFSLAQLRQRIIERPEKKKRAERIDKSREILSKVTQHQQRLQQTLRGKENAARVFDGMDFSKVDEKIRKAAGTSRRLLERLRQEPARISDPSTADKVADVGTFCQSADKALLDQWQTKVNTLVAQYDKLIAALERLNLKGADTLAGSLTRLKGSSDRPPHLPEKAAALRADVEALRESVAQLGLSGPVGKFLTKAADRNIGGDPKDLLNPEIRAFFEDNKLWGMIRVGFKN